MSDLSPLKLQHTEVIRNVEQVVNTNAGLLIVDGTISGAGVLTLITDGGDEVTIDLSSHFRLRSETEEINSTTPGSEINSGTLRISTEPVAKLGDDDTTAISPLKLKLVLDAKNLPTFEFDDEKTGDLLKIVVDEEGNIIVTNKATGSTSGLSIPLSPADLATLKTQLAITWRSLLRLPNGNDVGDIDIRVQSLSLNGEVNPEKYDIDSALGVVVNEDGDLVLTPYDHDRDAQYKFVQASDPTFQILVDRLRFFNMVLTGSKNYYRVTKQGELDPNGTPLEAGLFGLIDRLNGSQLVDYFFGRFTSGGVGFRNATGRSIALTGTEMLIDATVTTTTGILEGQRIRTASLPLATKPIKGAWTGEYNPLTDKYDQVFSTGEQLAELVRPYLSGTGTQVPGDARPVLEVLCRDVDSGSAPVVNPPVRITPGMVGVPQSHSLNTPGTNIFPILLDKNNRFDQIMVINFPSNTTFQIDYPQGLSSGYDGGSLELKKFS